MAISVGDDVEFMMYDKYMIGTITSIERRAGWSDVSFEIKIWIPDINQSVTITNFIKLRLTNKLQSYGA